MGDLISRDALLKQFRWNCEGRCQTCTHTTLVGKEEKCSLIVDAPTVEAVPVVRGEWERTRLAGEYLCSNCQSIEYASRTTMAEKLFPFCPNCGADMRGER